MDEAYRNLGAAASAAEAAMFVGREDEFQSLIAASVEAAGSPIVVWVHGPPGVGKSALLRAYRRWCSAAGRAVVALDGHASGDSRMELSRSLGHQLGMRCAASRVPADDALIRTAQRRARAGGLSVLVDAYEQLLKEDRWFRRDFLYSLGPGTLVVLAGRSAPEVVWADDPGFALLVRRIALGDLTEAASAEYMRRAGLDDAQSAREVYALSHGRPLLLTLAAGLVRAGGMPEGGMPEGRVGGAATADAAPGRRHLASRLLSHLVETADLPELEAVVQAACLVHTFDRDLLAAMVGERAIAAAWPALVALPVVRVVGDRYTVHEAVRRPVNQGLQRSAPWLNRRWRRRAIAEFATRLRGETTGALQSLAWREVRYLSASAPWRSRLDPWKGEDEAWQFRRGAEPSDLDVLVACRRTALSASFSVAPVGLDLGDESLKRLLATCADQFILARDARGRVVGYCAPIPLGERTLPALLADPASGALLRWLEPDVVRRWLDRTLVLTEFGLLEPAPEGYFALVREACGELAWYDRLAVVTALPTAPTLAALLGGRVMEDFAVMLPGRTLPNRAYQLEVGSADYADWLASLAEPLLTATIAPGERALAARAFMAAIMSDDALVQTAAAGYFAAALGEPTPRALRAWADDALNQAPLREADRRLLARYYLERAGPHERLAEAFGLSRRNYFRHHHEALEAVGDWLFA